MNIHLLGRNEAPTFTLNEMTLLGATMSQIESISSIKDLQTIIDVIPNPVFIKNREHRMVLVNQGACDLFGHSREALLTKSDWELWPADQVLVFRDMDNRVFATGQDNENEEQLTTPSGSVRTVVTRKRLVHLGGEPFLVAVVTDVTAYREAEAHNRYLAFHDPLTALPNRALLNERIDQALMRTRRTADQHALLYIDLDRFKEVNDTYGHQAGDELIRDFAGRLSSLIRTTDTVARLGGDEFAVLLNDIHSPVEVERICHRILNAAAQPFEVTGAQAFVHTSIGVVFTPPQDISRIELQRRADVALYKAKNDGRGCFRIFDDEMDENIRRRRLIEDELRKALIEDQGLEVYYQPIVSAGNETVTLLEALIRWNHPRLGMLLPSQFIAVAEDTGLIMQLGDLVLRRASRTISAWPEISVAVNLSPVQLRDTGLADRVLDILNDVGLNPARLQLEITESAFLNADAVVTSTIQRLRKSGIKIALDDFGTGYSSLSHLRQFEVDKVKIDRSFVQHLGQLNDSAAIVQAVTGIGKALGLSVTAEGVEKVEQRDFLRASGCHELQGYLVSRPLPESAIAEFLDAGTVKSGPLAQQPLGIEHN